MRTQSRFATWVLALGLLPACGQQPAADAGKASPGKSEPDKTATKAPPPGAGATPAGTDPAADADADADPMAGIDKRVQRAATLAKKIEASPENAGDILDAAGLARDEFEDLIFEISTDPALAKQYEAAILAQAG